MLPPRRLLPPSHGSGALETASGQPPAAQSWFAPGSQTTGELQPWRAIWAAHWTPGERLSAIVDGQAHTGRILSSAGRRSNFVCDERRWTPLPIHRIAHASAI